MANKRASGPMYVAALFGRVLGGLHLPGKLAYQFMKGLRILSTPVNYIHRRSRARALVGDSPWGAFIDRSKGYALFDREALPDIERVAAVCRAIYDGHRASLDETSTRTGVAKSFFYNILNEELLDKHPELLEFAIGDRIAQAVTGYLGTIPVLRGMGIYVSPKNASTSSSQMFHLDYDDFKQVKCFVNIVDVEQEGGPFTFVPADRSAMIRSKLGHGWRDRRLTDDEVLKHCVSTEVVRLTGPAGSGGMVDTSRCLHFGSRARADDRVVFMFQFTSHPNVAFDHSKRGTSAGLAIYDFSGRVPATHSWKELLLRPDIGRGRKDTERVAKR